MTWDLDVELEKASKYPRRQDRVLAAMWAWAHELELVGADYARHKTEHDRLLGRAIVSERANGERSAEVAAHKAIAENDAIYAERLAYRTAEQRTVACREHLRRLHADLEDQRTQSADARAASTFHAADRSVA